MDTLKIDLYSALGKDGYKRLMYIKFGQMTDLTNIFQISQEGKTLQSIGIDGSYVTFH